MSIFPCSLAKVLNERAGNSLASIFTSLVLLSHYFAWKTNFITAVFPHKLKKKKKEKKKTKKKQNMQARHFRNEVSFLSSAASTGTQTHSLVAAKVTNLLVWVQEIRFGKQSGAASRQKSPAAPASGCLRSGRSACWSPRPAAALRSLGKYWPRLGSFSRVFLQSKLFPLITPATCLSPESSLL